MSCAIVILNYNDAKLTINYLTTIKRYSVYDYIIVVDNASTDGMSEMLKLFCEENDIDFIRSDENRGYSAGNNLGAFYAIEQYHPDYIVISNPDIVCPEESIQIILDAFSGSSKVGLVTGLVHVYDANHVLKEYPYFAYRVPTLTDMLFNTLLVFSKIRMSILNNSIYYNPSTVKEKGRLNVGAVSGCYFAIRSDVFQMIGGLDEEIFLYNEESVLGYKLLEAGYREVVVNALVIHDENKEKRTGLKKQWITHKRVQKSALVYLRKYLNAGTVARAVYCGMNTFGFFERYLLYLLRRGRDHD